MIEVTENQQGRFEFSINSISGSILMRSNPFNNEKEVLQVMKEIKDKPIFERKTNNEGKFIIHLKTKKGKIIGVSNAYTSEAGMENGIKNISKNLNQS